MQTIALRTEKKIPDNFRELVEEMGVHVVDWIGNCEGAVRLFMRHFPIKGSISARGAWTQGTEAFGDCLRPFTQHSWIQLEDERVLDPTRWVFEGVAPYIYVGESDYYDYGTNALNAIIHDIPDTPYNKPGTKELDPTDADLLRTYGVRCFGDKVHHDDLWWLSRMPPTGQHKALYEFFEDQGMQAMIPIDNFRLLMDRKSLEPRAPEDGVWFTAPKKSIH